MEVAIIDLGTNSLRLFIYKYSDKKNSFRRVLKLKRMVRLGDNAFKTGFLDKDAAKRTLKVFKEFKNVLDKNKPEFIKVVATSALRSVKDNLEFVEEVKKKTDINIEIISGELEANYIAKGVLSKIKLPNDNLVFIDIGGGSTEISLINNQKIITSASLKLGAGRCQQLFLKTSPPTKEAILSLKEDISKKLVENFPENFKAEIAVGTSGSIRAFNRIVNNDKSRIQIFYYDELNNFISKISSMGKTDLLQLPNLEDERVDLILSAGIILNEVLNYFGKPSVYVTSVALKDGILTDYIPI